MQLQTIIIRNIHSYIFNDLHFLIDDFITLYYDSAFAGSSHWGHFLAQFQIDYLFICSELAAWAEEEVLPTSVCTGTWNNNAARVHREEQPRKYYWAHVCSIQHRNKYWWRLIYKITAIGRAPERPHAIF